MKVYHRIIKLAKDEWGSPLMEQVAAAELDRRPESDVYVVEVWEHAGWHLAYAKLHGKVVCVASANGSAVFSPEVREFHRQIREAEWVYLPAIDRNVPEHTCAGMYDLSCDACHDERMAAHA